jgi:DNA polymerase-1
MEKMKNIAREQGYVSTLFGRRCHLPTINDKNPMLRQFAERQAINAPLQGSNADIIKKAMIDIAVWQKTSLQQPVHMVMQVHDELVFEVPETEIDDVKIRIRDLMEKTVTLNVPLVVSIGVGNNWDEAH